MTTIMHTAILDFSAEQIYTLVADIESYPQFLRWCRSAKISERSEQEVCASLTVAKGFFEKTFTTRNYMVTNKSMKLTLVEGPFTTFEGLWEFEPLAEQKCRVTYTMIFEFKNRLIAKIAEPIFAEIADNIISAFKKRAQEIYV